MNINRWAWLFPVTYVLHVAEEYWAGFPEWMTRMGVPFSTRELLVMNGIGLCAMVVAILTRWRWPITTLAGIVFVNGMLHVVVSVVSGSYSPGVATGVLLWIPLGLFVLIHEWRKAPGPAFARGLIGVLVFHLIATLAVMKS